jgi:hypothetical protein
MREAQADSFISLAQQLRTEGEEYRLDGLSVHGPNSSIAENLYQLGRRGERNSLLERLEQLQATPPLFQSEVWQIVGDLTEEILDRSEAMWGVPLFGKHAARPLAGLPVDEWEVMEPEGLVAGHQTVTGGNTVQVKDMATTDSDEQKPWSTAELLVRQYLKTHPHPQIDEAKRSTSLSENKIRRTQAWKNYENETLDDHLQRHPDANTSDLQREFGFSAAKTVGMDAWKAHRERIEAAKPPRKVRERPLTDDMAICRPDERTVEPHVRVDHRDQLFRTILENADSDTRGQMHRLPLAEREMLLDHVVRSVEDTAFDGSDKERTLAIVLEVARSWLEVREQEKRECGRKGRIQ